jgi:hypothetical protein
MPLLEFALVSLILFRALAKGHLSFAAVILVVAAYELVGRTFIIFFDMSFLEIYTDALLSDSVVLSEGVGSILFVSFVLAFSLTYLFLVKLIKIDSSSTSTFFYFPEYRFIVLAIFVFGLLALSLDSGSVAKSDYSSGVTDGAASTRFLHYGQTLYVVLVPLLYLAVKSGKWFRVAALILFATPLTIEMFESGRRQFFFPALVIFALIVNSDATFKGRALVNLAFICVSLLFFGVQFALRTDGDPFSFRPLYIQFSELVLIHITTLNAFFAANSREISYGTHYVIAALHGIPYLSVPAFISDTFNIAYWNYDHQEISPLGGLSMIGDSVLAFYYLGPLMLGIFFALLAFYSHSILSKINSNIYALSKLSSILILCHFSIGLTYYRNGLSHYIKYLLSFFIMMIFFYYLNKIIFYKNRLSKLPSAT